MDVLMPLSFLSFWPYHPACKLPWLGIEPCPLQWKHRILTIELPGQPSLGAFYPACFRRRVWQPFHTTAPQPHISISSCLLLRSSHFPVSQADPCPRGPGLLSSGRWGLSPVRVDRGKKHESGQEASGCRLTVLSWIHLGGLVGRGSEARGAGPREVRAVRGRREGAVIFPPRWRVWEGPADRPRTSVSASGDYRAGSASGQSCAFWSVRWVIGRKSQNFWLGAHESPLGRQSASSSSW